MFCRHLGGFARVHVAQVLFGDAGHARADDIQHCQYARAGLVDNQLLEVLEVAPAG
jgi:hypothetical protein